MAQVSQAWAAAVTRKTGHDPQDAGCRQYRGDFAGIDLEAKCRICRDPDAREMDFVRRADSASNAIGLVGVLGVGGGLLAVALFKIFGWG